MGVTPGHLLLKLVKNFEMPENISNFSMKRFSSHTRGKPYWVHLCKIRRDSWLKPFALFCVSMCGFILLKSVLHGTRPNSDGLPNSWTSNTLVPVLRDDAETTEELLQMSSTPKGRIVLERRSFTAPRECRNYTTKLYEEGTFGTTALVSYPGSGNTWLRHLIEMASGIFTGSVYFDDNLYSRGLVGEKEIWDSGTTVVQKSHMRYTSHQQFGKAIILIRDPITSTRAFVQYLESGHTGWSSPTTFLQKDWPKYMLHSAFNWLALSKSWLESNVDLLVIHYEDLRDNPVAEVSRICTFLHVDCSRIASACFTMNIEGAFHRRKTLWKTKMFLPLDDLKRINLGILQLNDMLKHHNQKEVPFEKYTTHRNESFIFIHNRTHF